MKNSVFLLFALAVAGSLSTGVAAPGVANPCQPGYPIGGYPSQPSYPIGGCASAPCSSVGIGTLFSGIRQHSVKIHTKLMIGQILSFS